MTEKDESGLMFPDVVHENSKDQQISAEEEDGNFATAHVPGPMDGLPQEWIEMMMRLLSLPQVCVCMSVNRKWAHAAKHVLKIREKLTLMSVKRFKEYSEILTIKNRAKYELLPDEELDVQSMAKSLQIMTNLKELRVLISGSESEHFWAQLVHPLVLLNAETLETLETIHKLPFESDEFPAGTANAAGAVITFPKLRTLCCSDVSGEALAAMPVLQTLTIMWKERPYCDFLEQLPAQRLKVFAINFRVESDQLTDGEAGRLVREVQKLPHLTCFCLQNYQRMIPDFLLNILDNFTKLVHLDLLFDSYHGPGDDKIDRLVNQNPSLECVTIARMDVTDSALISLSRLQRLEHLSIDRGRFTADGMLSLLKGWSRAVLHVVHLSSYLFEDQENQVLLSTEVQVMANERGDNFRMIPRSQTQIAPDYGFIATSAETFTLNLVHGRHKLTCRHGRERHTHVFER